MYPDECKVILQFPLISGHSQQPKNPTLNIGIKEVLNPCEVEYS